MVYPYQENVETNQNAAKAVVGIEENKIPLTLSQKVRDYSSIHFATPSFRFYQKFQNEIINVKQKPPKLQSHTPSSQQAIGNNLDQHIQNTSTIKKYKVNEIIEKIESRLPQFDILNEIPKFVNNIFNLKKT